MILEEDTLFYRCDHPNGFLFSAGNEAPEGDGWVAAQEDIEPAPPRDYECTTLAAYEALLRGERAAAAATASNLVTLVAQLASARGLIAHQAAQIAELEALIPSSES